MNKINQEKVAEINNKQKHIVNIAILVAMLVSYFSPYFGSGLSLYVFLVLTIVWLIVCSCFDFERVLCLAIVILIPEFFGVNNLFPISVTVMILTVTALVFLVKYLIKLLKKEKILSYQVCVMNIVLILYGLINFNLDNIKTWFIHILMMALFFVVFIYFKEVKVKSIAKYYIYGLCAVIMVGFIFTLIPQLESKVWYIRESKRFLALCANPNQLQVMCAIGISVVITLFFNKNLKIYESISLLLIFIVAGFFTLSKSFIVCILINVLIAFILLLKKYQKQRKIICVVSIICVFAFVGLFYNKISAIFQRFTAGFDDSLVDAIFTGRFSIWQQYLSAWAHNVGTIFFGCGVTAGEIVSLGTHNVYINLLYRFGIIGIVLIGVLTFIYIKNLNIKIKRISLINILAFVMMLLLFFVENLLVMKYSLIFLLSVMILFSENKSNIKGVEALTKDKLNKKISVIVPIYKVEEFLEVSVNSIINQTYHNLEIILVDDGSPDNCPQICDQLAKKDKRIKVIHKKNGGVSSARNAGLKAVTGDYIFFVDSDDYIDSQMCEIMVKLLQDNNADISMCSWRRIKDVSQFKDKQYKDQTLNALSFVDDDVFDLLFNKKLPMIFVLWAKLYKKELFENIEFPEGKIHEDEATIHKILLNCKKLSFVDYPMYGYLKRDNSITTEKFSVKRLDALRVLRDRIEFVKANKPQFEKSAIYQYVKALILYYYQSKWAKLDENIIASIRKEIDNYCNNGCKSILTMAFYRFPRTLGFVLKIRQKNI